MIFGISHDSELTDVNFEPLGLFPDLVALPPLRQEAPILAGGQ
jgi:hypothetical protein